MQHCTSVGNFIRRSVHKTQLGFLQMEVEERLLLDIADHLLLFVIQRVVTETEIEVQNGPCSRSCGQSEDMILTIKENSLIEEELPVFLMECDVVSLHRHIDMHIFEELLLDHRDLLHNLNFMGLELVELGRTVSDYDEGVVFEF